MKHHLQSKRISLIFFSHSIALLLFIGLSCVQAQVYNGSIMFQDQIQIDTFPPYTTITGDLSFSGANITNVDSLYHITEVHGDLDFNDADSISNLDGLSSLTTIGGSLFFARANSVTSNQSLTNLDGLASLDSIGEFLAIVNFDALIDINGLSGISYIGNNINIADNGLLSNLDGLAGLSFITSLIRITDNTSLLDIDGLANIDSVHGQVSIISNPSLKHLDGLSSLVYAKVGVWIEDNQKLTHLNGLSNLTACGQSLVIRDNENLFNIQGLYSLTSLGAENTITSSNCLSIMNNEKLTTLEGLNNVDTIGASISIMFNPLLQEVDALSKVTSIPGQLNLTSNSTLKSVYGFRNVTSVGSKISARWNPDLNDCCGFFNYVSSVGAQVAADDIYSNGLGCSPTDILLNGPCEERKDYFLSGYVYQDPNEDCESDSTENPISYQIIQAEPGAYYGATNQDGIYQLLIDTGIYSVFVSNTRSTWMPCDTQITATVLSSDSIIAIEDMGVQISDCPDLSLDISGFWNRRCADDGQVSLVYCNWGLTAASQAQLRIKIPEYMTVQAASHNFNYETDSTLLFDLGTIEPDQCRSISLATEISCASIAILGLTQCIEGWIVSPDICQESPPDWSGASLAIDAQCVNSINRFRVINEGTTDMDDSTSYRIYADTVLVQIGHLMLGSGDTLMIDIPGSGQTFRLEVDQVPHHPSNQMVAAALEGCVATLTSGSSRGLVNEFPTPVPNPTPVYAVNCHPIIGAYDPNDKQVVPTGFGSAGLTRPESRLQYLIRFQNTGTDTAFKVVVIDTLSSNLDLSSFRIEAASHPYRLEVDGQGQAVLHFIFEDILLPDSNVNETASHGFIRFSIDHESSAPLGTEISNFADIYFDFNPPIRTNTTLNTLSNFQAEDIGSVSGITLTYLSNNSTSIGQEFIHDIHIFPNPAENLLYITGENTGLRTLMIEWLDLQGRIIQTSSHQVASGSFKHKEVVPTISAGLYFIRINGQYLHKVMIQD